jgi:5,5'-dehydrodivanillate O-demethylase
MAAVHPILAHDLKLEFGKTGAGTLAGKYLRQFWQPVLNSEDLLPGKSKPIRIMGDNFTLFRGDSGAAHVIAERCSHRSTFLHTGWVEGDELRCLYHGWKFGGDGRCVEQPNEKTPFLARAGVKGYPTREHLGLIFCFLGEGEPPPFPPFPAFEDDGFVETRSTVYPCNWFQTHENNYDPCHIVWSHGHGITHADFLTLDMSNQPEPQETAYGTVNVWHFSGLDMVMVGFLPNAIRTIVPSPNGLLKKGLCPQYRDTYLIHVPVDDENHIFFRTQNIRVFGEAKERYIEAREQMKADWRANWKPDTWYMEEIFAGRLHLADIPDHPYLATIQDMVAQVGQGRSVDRSLEKLGQSDRHMNFLRRILARELSLVAGGQPTRRWEVMQDCPELTEAKRQFMAAGTM